MSIKAIVTSQRAKLIAQVNPSGKINKKDLPQILLKIHPHKSRKIVKEYKIVPLPPLVQIEMNAAIVAAKKVSTKLIREK